MRWRIARLSHGLHIPCCSHQLALAAKTIVEKDLDLTQVLDHINNEVGNHIRNSISMKVSAAIRNQASKTDHRLANMKPKSGCATRQWLDFCIKVVSHKRLSPYISDCATKKISNMRQYSNTTEAVFLDRVDAHLRYLKPLRKASKMMQKPLAAVTRFSLFSKNEFKQKAVCMPTARWMQENSTLTTAFLPNLQSFITRIC